MKSEVRRGRKFVEYHDPETQDEFTFTQEISGADVSYQETDGAWHQADENWATDGVDGFVLKNDKLNHKVRMKGNGGRNWYPRRNVNTEYMTFGVPQYRNGNKWSNFSFSGWSVEGKTITLQTRQGVTILVHNRWNGIKIDWVLASSTAPSRMRYPVSLTGITYVDGIIYGADGAELGRLTPTTATDSSVDERGMPTQLPCSGSYSGGYVEFQTDVTGAVYPVTIDPDFAGGTEDSTVVSTNADYATARSTSSSINLTGTTKISVGQALENPGFWIMRGFLKFDTSSISPDTVSQVNLKLVCIQDVSQRNFDIQIVKQDWSAQDPIATANREAAFDNCLSGTADDSIWRNTNGMDINTQYTSGNLATAWVNTSAATYYSLRGSLDVAASAPTTNNQDYVAFASSEHPTESYRPVLSVTYTEAVSGTLRRTNMNAQMSNLTGGFN